jgi:hypothetical protein
MLQKALPQYPCASPAINAWKSAWILRYRFRRINLLITPMRKAGAFFARVAAEKVLRIGSRVHTRKKWIYRPSGQ